MSLGQDGLLSVHTPSTLLVVYKVVQYRGATSIHRALQRLCRPVPDFARIFGPLYRTLRKDHPHVYMEVSEDKREALETI